MGSEADKGPRSRGSKRSASRVEIGNGSTASAGGDLENASQVTQKSSFTAAHYRNFILKGANIRFQFRLAPEDIRTQITAIVQPEASPERKEELSRTAQKLHDDFADVLDTAAREDDCVELSYQALSSMGYSESLTLPRKADWQPTLKPRIHPTKVNLDHLYRSEDEAKESLERPSKRQQGGEDYLSPDTSGVAVTGERMGPPSIPQSEAALQIRFPFLLVEGKSYATGRAIYEAQNQATISGACSLKILHDLDDLVRKSNPGSYSKGQPVVFSVCTEGPIHQLWVHYTAAGDGDGDSNRMYYMAQIKTCDVAICNDVPGFLEAVDNVMRWGSGKYKETTVEQLKT
ncbi:MAG: hypothetical protein MMC33_009528, partial [Icmadophila ericetorum]|nr:hypothetical protein [Icmadophila ericetorum]